MRVDLAAVAVVLLTACWSSHDDSRRPNGGEDASVPEVPEGGEAGGGGSASSNEAGAAGSIVGPTAGATAPGNPEGDAGMDGGPPEPPPAGSEAPEPPPAGSEAPEPPPAGSEAPDPEFIASCSDFDQIWSRRKSSCGECIAAAQETPCADIWLQLGGACRASANCANRNCLCERSVGIGDCEEGEPEDTCDCIDSCLVPGANACRDQWTAWTVCIAQACAEACGE